MESIVRDFPYAYFLAAGGCEHQGDTLQAWAKLGEWKWLGVQAESYPFWRGPDLQRLASLTEGCGFPKSYRIDAGFPIDVPEWRECKELLDLGDPETGSAGWLIKPLQSGGGHGIERLTRKSGGAMRSEAVVLQEVCQGRSISVVYWGSPTGYRSFPPMESITERHPWYRWTSAPTPFAYCGNVGPAEVSHRVRQTLDTWGAALYNHHPWQGWLQVDWIVTDQDFCWLLEINPRWSQSMELLESMTLASASSPLPPRSWVRCLLDGELPEPISESARQTRVGKLILYADRDLTVGEGAGTWMWEGRWNREREPALVHLQTPVCADIPEIGANIPQGAPICSVILPLERESMLAGFVTQIRTLLLS